MEFQVLQENLSKGIGAVSGIIGQGSQIAILDNLILKAKKEKLVVGGTNLETAIFASIPAKVIKEGEMAVSAKKFNELVQSLPAGKLEIALGKEEVMIRHGMGKAKMPQISTEDFPVKELPSPPKDKKGKIKLGAEKLAGAIRKTAFAAAADLSRPALTGILLEAGEGEIRAVATDGYRLSMVIIGLDKEIPSHKGKTLISAKAMQELAKNIQTEGKVTLFTEEEKGQAIFWQEGFVLGTRVIEAEYPPYERIIPGKASSWFEAEKGELVAALRSAAVFARDSANIVKLEISKDRLGLSAQGGQTGESNLLLNGAKTGGEDLKIAFNYRYLVEGLAAMKEAEMVRMEFSGPLAPAKLTQPGEAGYLQVIMPVKTQGS